MFFFTVDEKIPVNNNNNDSGDDERACTLTWFLWHIAEGATQSDFAFEEADLAGERLQQRALEGMGGDDSRQNVVRILCHIRQVR